MAKKEAEAKWHWYNRQIGYAIIRDDGKDRQRLEKEFDRFCRENNFERK